MAEYTNADALVDTEWLAEHVDDGTIRVIEVDEDTTAYEKGHIRNAVGWNWFDDLHAKPRRDYVGQDGLSRLLQQAGVGRDTTVVLYGGNNNWFAAYAYWLLRYLGFDNVKLLDGGRKKWELESRELTTDVPEHEVTDFTIKGKVRNNLRVLRDDVLKKVGKAQFVDVRSPEEYRGELLAPAHLCRATSRGPPTSLGARPPTRTAPSSPPTSSRPSTRGRASRPARRSSPTAASASARPTRGSS